MSELAWASGRTPDRAKVERVKPSAFRVVGIALLGLLWGCSTVTRPPPSILEPWRVDLPDPGGSQITGLATQAGDVLAIGSFEGETTLGGQHLASAGEHDVLVARLARDGRVRWARQWGSAGDDLGEAIEAGADGSVLVMGSLAGEVEFDGVHLSGGGGLGCFIAKLAGEDGHTLWVRRFGGAGEAACRAAAFNRAGDVFVTGRFKGEVDFGGGVLRSAGENDVFLLQLSGQDGAPRWAHVFGGAGDDVGRDVMVDASGTVLLTGHFSSGVEPSAGAVDFGAGRVASAGDSDAFLAAFSDDGRCLWSRAIGGPNFDMAKSVVPAPDGGTYLTGLFQRDVPHAPGQLLFSLGGFEGFVARYSARGEELWRHRYPAMTSGHALALTPSGALVLAGHFTSTLELGAGWTLRSAGKNDALVAAFGSEGDVRWAHGLGGPEHEFGYAVTAVGEGVAVAGMSASHGFITWLPLR